MTKQFIIRILLSALFVCNVILFVSCHNSVEPDKVQKLLIENGFYKIVPSKDTTEIRCAVQFEYLVTKRECQIGGYAMKCDSMSWALDMYRMQTLVPEIRYTMTDTFRSSEELTTNPIITMQGYRIGDSQSYPELKTQYVLLPKP